MNARRPSLGPAWGLIFLVLAVAGEARETLTPHLRIATKATQPFVMQDTDGDWAGLTRYLLDELSREVGFTYGLEAATLEEMLDGVAAGNFDAAASAITITSEREVQVDFTHPYFDTGLAIAVPARASWTTALRSLFTPQFLSAVGTLVLLVLGVGILVWILERRANPDEFGGSAIQGVGSGFWWSAVTMTTVGYGDKAPRSFMGRVVGLVWMFTAIIVISGLTAAITSGLTVSQLESSIRSVDDLTRVRVGALRASTSATALEEHGVDRRTFATVGGGLAALAAGEIDAMVHDEPVLRYLVRTIHGPDLQVLDVTFEPQQYGIALPPGSPLREPMNRALLEILVSQGWQTQQSRYLGSE